MIGTELPQAAAAPGLVADGIGFGIPAVTEGGHIRKLEEVESDMIRLALSSVAEIAVFRIAAGHGAP